AAGRRSAARALARRARRVPPFVISGRLEQAAEERLVFVAEEHRPFARDERALLLAIALRLAALEPARQRPRDDGRGGGGPDRLRERDRPERPAAEEVAHARDLDDGEERGERSDGGGEDPEIAAAREEGLAELRAGERDQAHRSRALGARAAEPREGIGGRGRAAGDGGTHEEIAIETTAEGGFGAFTQEPLEVLAVRG